MSKLPIINWRLPKYFDKEESEGKISNENRKNLEKLSIKRKDADRVFGNVNSQKTGRFETCGNTFNSGMQSNLQKERSTTKNRFFKNNLFRDTSGLSIDLTHSKQQEYFSNNKSPKQFYVAKDKSIQTDPIVKTKTNCSKQSKLKHLEETCALNRPKLTNIGQNFTGLKGKKYITKKSYSQSNINSKTQKKIKVNLTDEKASESQAFGRYLSKKPNNKPNYISRQGKKADSLLDVSLDNYDGCIEDPTALDESCTYELNENVGDIHTDLHKKNYYSIKENCNPNCHQVKSQKDEISQINRFANVENDFPDELNDKVTKKIISKDIRKIMLDCESLIDTTVYSEPEDSNQSTKGDCTIIDKLLEINSEVESSHTIIGHQDKVNKKTQPQNSQINRILNINSLKIRSDEEFTPDSEYVGFTLQDFLW